MERKEKNNKGEKWKGKKKNTYTKKKQLYISNYISEKKKVLNKNSLARSNSNINARRRWEKNK